MDFKLPELPYSSDAFDGFLSPQSFHYHYGKHHLKYVETTNALLKKDAKLADLSLEELVCQAEGPLFNNAAQAWNHTFFWLSINPRGSEASHSLHQAVQKSFGGMDAFKKAFVEAGKNVFGSGWVWLVADDAGKLEITPTANAGNPLREGKRPLLCVDVWEHAYYIDHRNARDIYLEQASERLSWRFANENYDRAEPVNLTVKMVSKN
jgi:Fe-Mn family superoxide dismutase